MSSSNPTRDEHKDFCESRQLLLKDFDYERYVEERTKFKRRGKCKRCGRCCTARGLLSSSLHGAERTWEGAEELKAGVVERYGEEGRELAEAVLALACPDLKIIKRGAGKRDKAFCKKHASRPSFCKQFPELPSEVTDGCGFYFVEKGKGP